MKQDRQDLWNVAIPASVKARVAIEPRNPVPSVDN